MAPTSTETAVGAHPRAPELSRFTRVSLMAALAAMGVGALLAALQPDGSGPVLSFVGLVSALAIHWWRTNV